MLLEIEFGIKIEKYRMPEDLGPDGEPTINADHIASMEVFNLTELWEEKETFGALKDLIKNCLAPDEFNEFSKDVEGLRDAFKKHIVDKLWVLYKKAWEDPDTSYVRAIELGPPIRPLSETTNDTVTHISPLAPPLPTPSPETREHHTPYYSPLAHLGTRVYEPSPSHPEQ
ncbi:hypothetical protein BDV97DRAFT_147220 [Delphinella strobiligena]|nr:hypothetical protein BDV97DRAFT_147220 [Delphinella strobiligena]